MLGSHSSGAREGDHANHIVSQVATSITGKAYGD